MNLKNLFLVLIVGLILVSNVSAYSVYYNTGNCDDTNCNDNYNYDSLYYREKDTYDYDDELIYRKDYGCSGYDCYEEKYYYEEWDYYGYSSYRPYCYSNECWYYNRLRELRVEEVEDKLYERRVEFDNRIWYRTELQTSRILDLDQNRQIRWDLHEQRMIDWDQARAMREARFNCWYGRNCYGYDYCYGWECYDY